MGRKEFYIAYYNRTNRAFSDKIIWGKEEREEAWRKGQCLTSKSERKIFIIIQYIYLLVCWVPMCFDLRLWVVAPIALLLFFAQSIITDFSMIKVEWLYFIYRQNNVYSSVLCDIFFGNFTNFLDKLKRLTKKKVIGYVRNNGGKFCVKYCAVCRNKSSMIAMTFKRNRVVVKVNEKTHVMKKPLSTKEELTDALAAIINEYK